MKLFKQRAEPQTLDEAAAEALIVPGNSKVTRNEAKNVAAIYSCVAHISEDIAALPIRLYKRDGDKVEEVKGDRRVFLLNEETGDTLTGQQLKRALIRDYFLGKGGYCYINKDGTNVKSLHYVRDSDISFMFNTDPIFKEYKIMVSGATYWPHDFVKILRNTENGRSGISIIDECQLQIKVSYKELEFERNLVETGGNKKGFLQASKRVSQQVLDALKAAFRRLYSSSNENVVVLNEGITFQEASNTSVEMQLNENKKSNADEICKIFKMPPRILTGGETEEERISYLQYCLLPVISEIHCSLNRDLLLEKEKGSYFFAVDTSEFTKGDIEKRFKAYEIASKNGFMQTDEIRRRENLPDLNLDFIKLGLQDVLYDVKSKKIFIPNMGQWMNMDESEVNTAAEKTEAGKQNQEKGQELQKDQTGGEVTPSLNGAQIQSVVDVVEAVHNGIIEKEAAIELLTKSLSFDRESARKIIGNNKIQEVAPVQQKGENIEN